jgi:hypothetical protein
VGPRRVPRAPLGGGGGRGGGEVSLAKIEKAMQRCDKSEDISTAGLAECVRAEGDVGTMSKTASNAAVFGGIPTGTWFLGG